MSETPKSLSMEESLAELEDILSVLESNTTSLEESLSQYERGVSLLKQCYATLSQAELKILKLTGSEDGTLKFENFSHTASSETPAEEAKPATRARRKASKADNEELPF
ncbi:exodeoxyribonuclease VII small subunit [Telmatocola sphagniphila]|uniref:Exodeoxyribonuclease 7 small subunit n=1 Tax=Telmatocola sphagniphila TaxID=1123043 RepID=A0A8E6B893_9BACT|nr:exodeoxyribonuclease VII small subunit [Telmatocola sphagniphila]QVL33314.1 exodeoxyribonuclease VII small subunit [Telmatocola sphagniphila]